MRRGICPARAKQQAQAEAVADADLSTPHPVLPSCLLCALRLANHCNHWRHLCFVKPFFFWGSCFMFFFCPFCHVLDILDCVSNAVTKQAMLGQCKKYWACATQVTTASVNIAQWCAASSASCCQTAADRESRRACSSTMLQSVAFTGYYVAASPKTKRPAPPTLLHLHSFVELLINRSSLLPFLM